MRHDPDADHRRLEARRREAPTWRPSWWAWGIAAAVVATVVLAVVT